MKKALSFLLALAMLLSIIPMTALTSAAAVDDEAALTGETYGVSTGEALFAMLEKDTPAGDVMTINVNADISYYVTTQGVTGIDSYLRYACTLGQGKKAPWAAYGSKIESIEIKDSVTAIGAYAFAFLTDRTIEVRLPGNVKTIGEGAFYGVDITGFRICNTDCRIDNYAFGSATIPTRAQATPPLR